MRVEWRVLQRHAGTRFLIFLSRNLMMRYLGWSEKLSTDMRILYGLSSCNRSLTLRKLLCEDMAP